MSTMKDSITWVTVSKLKRPDLVGEATELCRKAFLSIVAKVPFDELRVVGSEMPLSTTVNTLDLSALNLAGIISLRLSANNTVRRLKRSDMRAFDAIMITNGIPYKYARVAKTLYFNTQPTDATWTVRPYYWSYPTLLSPVENTVLPWPQEWDELLDYELLYRLYIHIEEHQKAMMMLQPPMNPRVPEGKKTTLHEIGVLTRLWNDLLQPTFAREAIDEDFGINPIYRSYTNLRSR